MPERCRAENSEISMVARVVDVLPGSGEEVRVSVDFATGDRTQIPVPWSACDGDRVLINGEDAQGTERDDRTEYSITYDGSGPETVTVELDRANQSEVVSAEVTRPPRFEILAPGFGETLSRSEDHLLEWGPPDDGGQMQIELQEELGGGRCVVTDVEEHDYKGVGGIRVEDDGNWIIPGGVLTNDGDLRCEARYVMSRFVQGEYPEAFASGGFVEAQVLRIVVFESVP